MKNVKAIAGVVMVFVLGAVCGGAGTYLVHKSRMEAFINGGPEARESQLMQRLTRKLELDASQQEQIRPIVKETHDAIRTLRQQSRPRMEAILEESQRRIGALLRPEQQEKFRQLIAERRKHGHHGHPPP